MYFSFHYNGTIRAGRARQINLVHSVGGIDRNTFVITGNTVHIDSSICTPCTRREAFDIEHNFISEREERIAAAKKAYFAKDRNQ